VAAFNWIAFEGECPACGRLGPIRCQTHVASDYGGDRTGRFHDRLYRLGEPMAWWPRDHAAYARWREASEPGQPADQALEACYAACAACGADLYVVLRFEEIAAVEVVEFGLEAGWPSGYRR
jgi:hypothetical protein